MREVARRDDLADHLLDLLGERLGHLDARPGRRAQVDDELAGVGAREELGAESAGAPAMVTTKSTVTAPITANLWSSARSSRRS